MTSCEVGKKSNRTRIGVGFDEIECQVAALSVMAGSISDGGLEANE